MRKLSDYEKHNRNFGRLSGVDRRTKTGKRRIFTARRMAFLITIILTIVLAITQEDYSAAVGMLFVGGFITLLIR